MSIISIAHRKLLIFLLVTLSLQLSAATSNGSQQPNIVLVVMDNFGYGEIGVYGGGVLRGAPTPNIDSIGQQGFQSTNFNVEAECTPSRSALMTGRYGIRTRQRPGATAGHLVWFNVLGNYSGGNAFRRGLCHWHVWQVAFG